MGWAKRVVGKLDEEYAEENVEEIFKHICDKVEENLNSIQEEPSQKQNMLADFVSEDFMNKNIRVRPNSGKSEEETKSDSKAVLRNE